MATDLQGLGLNLLTRLAGSEWPDRLKIRRPLEGFLYQSSKTAFRAATTLSRQFKKNGAKGKGEKLASAPTTGLFDLGLTEEQTMMKDTLTRFAQSMRKAAEHADHDLKVSDELRTEGLSLGLGMYAVPEKHGGVATGSTVVTQMLSAEALAQGDFSIAAALLAPLGVANAITRWGTAGQQEAYLPAFASETPPLATIAVAEAKALFNPHQLATTAKREGAQWVLNGEKSLVLLGRDSELFLVAAHTDSGPQVFIVEAGAQGLSFREAPAMGLRAAATATLKLENVKLPEDARLGDGEFDYGAFLDFGNLAWCALAVGTCQSVLDYVIPYVNDRHAFGEPISHRQAVAFAISDIAIELDGMRLMTYRAAARAEQGLDFGAEVRLARLQCTEKALKIGSEGVQLLGGHGFTKEHPVERWYRDLRALGVVHGGLHL